MHKHRDTIKWAPFNAVINGEEVISNLIQERSKVNKPTLSEEQINELENKIIYYHKTKTLINIIYFKNNSLNKITEIIKKIDAIEKNIILNNNISLKFNDIIKISEKNT